MKTSRLSSLFHPTVPKMLIIRTLDGKFFSKTTRPEDKTVKHFCSRSIGYGFYLENYIFLLATAS